MLKFLAGILVGVVATASIPFVVQHLKPPPTNAPQDTKVANPAPVALSDGTPVALSDQQMAAAMEAVRQVLKDPGSATFENIRAVAHNGGLVICGSVNSKNGFGGYVGFAPFLAISDRDTGKITFGSLVANDTPPESAAFITKRCG